MLKCKASSKPTSLPAQAIRLGAEKVQGYRGAIPFWAARFNAKPTVTVISLPNPSILLPAPCKSRPPLNVLYCDDPNHVCSTYVGGSQKRCIPKQLEMKAAQQLGLGQARVGPCLQPVKGKLVNICGLQRIVKCTLSRAADDCAHAVGEYSNAHSRQIPIAALKIS